MSGQDTSPVITLTVGKIKTLAEVEKWSAIATSIGIPSTSTIAIDGLNRAVSVTAYLAQVPYPEATDHG